MLGAKLFGLYDRDEAVIRKTTLDEAPKLFQFATLCALVAWLAESPLGYGALTREDVLFLWLALVVSPGGRRAVARARSPCVSRRSSAACSSAAPPRNRRSARGWPTTVASGPRSSPTSICTRSRPGRPTLSLHDKLAADTRPCQRARRAPRDRRALAAAKRARCSISCRTLKAVGIRVSVVPQLLQVIGSSVEFDDLHGVTLMGVRRFDLTRSSAMVKRAFDLVGASLGLLAVSPLMIAIAIAIKLDSKGPVFFRQLRVGRDEQRFGLFKFRTMVPDAEQLKHSLIDRNEAQEGLFKIAEDPRVTRVGSFLRKTALDELPQLFNVLRGEMSLVGPRPLIDDEDRRIEGWHRRRLALHPGITGHWQILGPASVSLREMVAIDYLYVANWSLWTDIKILLRTVPHVLCRRGL